MNLVSKICAILFVFVLASMPVAFAQTTDYLSIETVRINGDRAEDGDDLYVERGDELRIRVTVEAGAEDVRNAEIQAFIAGYRYSAQERDLVSDFTRTFNLPAGNKRSFDLNVMIPVDMDQKDAKLRIVVADENSPNLVTYNYQLSIYGLAEQNAVQIRDFLISPSTTVEAGRALNFRVRVKNMGNHDLDDITARVAIPALGIQTFETIDSLRVDQTMSFEALLLRLPHGVEPGTYDVVTTVSFDRFESVQQTRTITVTAYDDKTAREEGSVVTVPSTVSLNAGAGDVIYPVLIENKDNTARTYVLTASGVAEWGRASFEPSSIVVIQGQGSETVFLRLSAREAAEAKDHVFQIKVESGDEVKTVNAVARVAGQDTSSTTNVRTILEWSLVVLIILLIILGLILVFTRIRKKDEESDEETQTYY
ncbi:MAG: hypothetical protein ACMXX9_01055 [Candidatus Woesearchaeota archaeon]